MPTIEEIIRQAMFEMMMGSYVGTDSPTTSLNRLENMFDFQNISPEIFSGTYWPAYTAPIPFDETPFLTNTLTAMQSSNPILAQVAQGLYNGEYTGLDAYQSLLKEFEGNANFDNDFILGEINLMRQEIAARDAARAAHEQRQIEDMRTNAYGKAGLPQPWEEYGFGEGQTPPAPSERTSENRALLNQIQDQIDSSGYEQFVAGEDQALALKLLASIRDRNIPEEDMTMKDDEGKPMYEARASYVLPGTRNQYGVPTKGGVQINYTKAKSPEVKAKEATSNVDLNKAVEMMGPFLDIFLASSKALPEYGKAKARIDEVYAKPKAELASMKARAGERKYVDQFLSTLDLMSKQQSGATPLSDAILERNMGTLAPWLAGTLNRK